MPVEAAPRSEFNNLTCFAFFGSGTPFQQQVLILSVVTLDAVAVVPNPG